MGGDGQRRRVKKDVRDTEFGRTDYKISRTKQFNKSRRREDEKKKFQNEQRYKRSFSKPGTARRPLSNSRSLSKNQNKQRLMKNNPNYIDLNKRGIGIEKSNQMDLQETFNVFEQKLQSLANRNQVFTKSGAQEALEKLEALEDEEKLHAEKRIQSAIRKQTLQLNNILGHESADEINKFLAQSMKFSNKQDIMRTFSQNLSIFDEMNNYLRSKMRQPYDIHKGEMKYMNYAPKYKNFAMVTSFLLKLKKEGVKVFRLVKVKEN